MEIDSKYERRIAWERDKQWKCQSSLFIESVKLLDIVSDDLLKFLTTSLLKML